jgi:Ras GTPase-activating-like protein IQGAP2/3
LGGQTAHVHFNPHVEQPELQQFQRSSTSHLRALSAFAQNGDGEEFAIRSKEHEVAGLNGRRKLQRGNSVRVQKAHTGWGGRTWMDQQRQYLQAYEYLCHIGEAKEWIEDIIQRSIPPIVELEEALRDGVVLAEIVQALHPDQRLRIFRGPTLTFRHSENVAIFFRLLEEVELPDLFWFELVDLYEKKNIPKVIYCIHSLSWLLWRKGMTDFRIGNLVGQLQFEDHELEATQKGLDRAGVSMPNFSEMGASFGAEPAESEDDRINRELLEARTIITDLQSQARGALLRQRLGDVMQSLWDAEGWIADLQSRIRGDSARAIVQYRLDMKTFAVDLQSAARGFLARTQARDARYRLKTQDRKVAGLQTLIRGYIARAATQDIRIYSQRHEHGIREFQAAIRGALARRNVSDHYEATRQQESGVKYFQACIRGALLRQSVEHDVHELHLVGDRIQSLQSIARGMLQRRTVQQTTGLIQQQETAVSSLQAAARAHGIRRRVARIQSQLQDYQPQWKRLQSVARAFIVRRKTQAINGELLQHSTASVHLQSATRAYLARHRKDQLLRALVSQKASVLALQAASLGCLFRQRTFDLLCTLNDQEASIISFQSAARGLLCRSGLGQLLQQLEPVEPLIMELQALARGKVVRTQFAEKMQHYKENMEKVIKIQSFVRGRQQGEAYKVLTSGKNPPVGTVKNFVHLLNDSDFDFDEEIEFERLRKTVVQRVRENTHAEQYIDQLDIKIALLVKNKITLDDVVRHQKHFGGHVGNLLANKDVSSSRDPLDLKALNKNSRKKLEHYQELFFLLQTQPQYLARLLRCLRGKALPEQEAKKIELLVMGIFGFAQKRREEYHLLKLMTRCIKEELDGCETLQDYLRGSSLWSKLLSSYARSPRDRRYLKDTLGPLVKEDIIENESLDLESDPMQIYRSAINNEELRTGQRSRRPADILREDAIRDPETRETFIRHLQDLRDIADHFLLCLEETVNRMPYGMRYMALEMFQSLSSKFGHEPEQHLLAVVGHWLWKFYIQPALLQPDTWGVVDRGLSPMQKRNLGEVSKVVGQIAAGRLFGGDNVYLQPINPYISEALGRIQDIWANGKWPICNGLSDCCSGKRSACRGPLRH